MTTDYNVRVFVDPMCAWAWQLSRWLFEVERGRDVDLTFKVMSLWVTHETTLGLDAEQRDYFDRAHRAARVALAVERDHGSRGLRGFYIEFATRVFEEGRSVDNALISEALNDADLPEGLLSATDDSDLDAALRRSHQAAFRDVGDGLGIPMVHLRRRHDGHEVGLHGPILQRCPRGAAALEVWDAFATIAMCPDVVEIRRARSGLPTFS